MKTIKFTSGLKLINNGYNNKVIHCATGVILKEFTDTIQGAVKYIKETYNAQII